MNVSQENRSVTLEWAAHAPPIKDVYFASESLGWAPASGGTIWRTEDSGKTWELTFADKDLNIEALQFLSNGRKGWAVGSRRLLRSSDKEADGILLTTEDGGSKWEPLFSLPKFPLNLLHFASDTNGCVGGNQVIQCTTDGGRSWTSKTAPQGFSWKGFHFLTDNRRGWAWTDSVRRQRSYLNEEPVRSTLFSTANGGQSWNSVGEMFADSVQVIKFNDEQNGWALTNNRIQGVIRVNAVEELRNRLLYTSDGGVRWRVLAEEELTGRLSDFHFDPDKQHGLMIGTTAPLSGGPLLLRTQDGGASWVRQEIDTDDPLFKLHYLPNSGSVWVLGGRNTLLQTQDRSNWVSLTKPGGQRLSKIYFATDGQRGWAYSSAGTIIHTSDGGVHWDRQYSNYPFGLEDLSIDDQGRQGWAIGTGESCSNTQIGVFYTNDGGREWKASCVEVGYVIHKGFLHSNGKGWAFGSAAEKGSYRVSSFPTDLIFSPDYGQNWRLQYTFQGTEDPHAAYFTADGTHGWIVTNEQNLFKSSDSGQTWHKSKIDPEPSVGTDFTINAVTFMPDALRGWAVGAIREQSLILYTTDSGVSWIRQEAPILNSELQSVTFLPDGQRGWATGSRGMLLCTSDGGTHWKVQTVIEKRYPDLIAAYFLDDAKGVRGWIVSNDGNIFRSVSAKTHPVLNRYEISSSATGVALKWQLANDPAPAWKLENLKWQIEYCSQKECTADTWQKVLPWQSLVSNSTNGSNVFSYTWNPADKGIAPGTQISYRIGVYDGNQWLMPQELGTHTFQPLWSRLTDWQKGLLIVLALILAYICVCLLLLAFRPIAVLWLHERLSLHTLIEPWAPAQLKPWLPTTLSFVPWLAKHRRVHEAWAKHYLATEDVKLSDLSPAIQKHYVKQDASLDAWVAKHLSRGQDLFLQLPTVAQRIIHILMPIQIDAIESGSLVVQPQAEHFRPYLQSPRVVLSIVGIGGAGKSSLACQLARWSMSPVEDQRLASHCMIPILIEEDTTDIPGVIKERLAIIAGDDLPEDLLENLLSKKRLLVIIDALSEKSKDMQDHVSNLYSTCPAYCLIITTRRPIHVLGVTPVTLRPQEITVDRLAYFLLEHLRATGREHLFPRRKALEVADRLLTIAEADGKDLPLTPLLVVLFANQAVKLAEAGRELNQLPGSVPETMIDYIKHLNLNKRLPERDLIDSALALARQSLGNDYVPKEFERRKAIAALAARNLWSNSHDSLQELANSGILEERESAGTILYRFKFDPVAEYMAAVERVRTLADDSKAWEEWTETLEKAEGYPKRMDGFLAALQVCVATYQTQFNLPFLQLQNEECPVLVSQNS